MASAKIIDSPRTVKVLKSKRAVFVSQKLPFYVRFEQVLISGYGPANPAPIGIAIVGFSNYIL